VKQNKFTSPPVNHPKSMPQHALSAYCAPGWPFAWSAACVAILQAMIVVYHILPVWRARCDLRAI
jgi:hypothetical protein